MSLKQTIKRILKEEKSKIKQFVLDSIDEIGLQKTSYKMGLPISKLVEISHTEINHYVAKLLILEFFNEGKLTKKFKEFEIKLNEEDTFIWICDNVPHDGSFDGKIFIEVMATPYYESQRSTPVELDWCGVEDNETGEIIYEFDGGGDFFTLFPNPKKFETIEDVIEWYELSYLYKVHKIITKNFLPPAIGKIEDELDWLNRN